MQKNDIAPELLSKALHAVAACKAGIPRVHVINGKVDEGLLAEVFSNEGIGTLIYANEYQQIRRDEKRRAGDPDADEGSGGIRRVDEAHARHDRKKSGGLFHLRD